MTIVVNMHQAKTQLSKLVEKACQGEEVILANNGTHVARIEPIMPADGLREPPARYAGTVKMSADFNDPLPPEYEGV